MTTLTNKKKSFNMAQSWLTILAFGLIFAGCSKFVDINDDPNNPTVPTLNLLLPATQISLAANFHNINEGGSTVSQHVAETNSGDLSRWNQSGNSFEDSWTGFYTQTIPDLETIIRNGTASESWGYVAIAKLEKAYLYSVLVDLWGDVPYSQANGDFPNPAFDDGRAIYESLFALIDEAIADMDRGFNVSSSADIFYQGSKASWERMANSLKLKLYNQIRLVDPVQAATGITEILNNDEPLIDDNGQDFTFRYGTSVAPNNRHPWYTGWYAADRGGASAYVSMPLIDRLKGQDDPRLRYYIFRQNERVGLSNSMNGEGYYGRYPGDAAASPADLNTRALPGIYPMAGLYDNGMIPSLSTANQYLNNEGAVTGTTPNSFKITVFTNGDGTGGGIQPFLTNFMVKFIRAEAALNLGTGEDDKQLLMDGVTAHLRLVNSVSSGNGGQTISDEDIGGFVERLGAQYEATASAEDKMAILMMQKWIALYGNGIEAYNDYRRTGLPVLVDLLSPLDQYPVRFFYSETEMTSNESVIGNRDILQRAQQFTPVFWDID